MDYNELDDFEQSIKDALEDQEESRYDAATWLKLEGSLIAVERASRLKIWYKVGAVAASVLLALSGAFFFLQDEEPNNEISSNTPPAKEEIVESTLPTIDSDQTTAASSLNKAEEEPEAASPEPTPEAYPAPIAGFTASAISGCPNQAVRFGAIESPVASSYTWNFGDGSYGKGQSPKHTYDKPGKYDVILTVKSEMDGRTVSKGITKMVTINEGAQAQFTWKQGSALLYEPTLKFELQSPDAADWTWKIGNRETKEEDPMHMFIRKGEYEVELMVENSHGCVAESKKKVRISNDYELYAPKDFSPNGDFKNDTWIPVALKYSDFDFTLSILDPNGTIVFNSSAPGKVWDGQIKGTDKVAQPGEKYVWVVILNDNEGNANRYGGVISITE